MLLERGTQLAALSEYAEQARSGEGRLVLVAGEAGIGKSSLLEELQADLRDTTWVWGACDGLFTPRPLAPLHDIARESSGSLSVELLADGVPRERVFDEVLAWLGAQPRLVVVVVEDVQWADDATLDLLRYVCRRLRSLRALLLVTFRDDALAATDPLRVVLGELSGQRSTRRIDLPPLSAEGVRRLASGTGHQADDLLRLTGGNPFFLVEALAQEGTEVPPTIRDAVLARTATLDDDARTVLEIAALDGLRVDAALVGTAAGTPLSTFDELVAAGLLTADGPSLRFRHELSRRAVESAIPPHRRPGAHRALLDALGTDCDDEARLAYHADGAGDAGLVRRYAPVAARRAVALGAHREATAQFERALRFPPDDPRLVAELNDEYADSLALVDRWEEAARARQNAIDIWHRLQDQRREGQDCRKLVAVMWRLCRGPESVAAQARAIELLEPLGPDPQLARALTSQALDFVATDPARAVSLTETALAMAESLGEQPLRSDVLDDLAYLRLCLREDWVPPMLEALRVALDANAESQAGRAYANAYTFFAAQYRFVEGERFWREGVAYCDDRDIATYGTCLRGHRAVALLDLGRWDEAMELAVRVLATEASPINLLTSEFTRGLILARRGLPDPFEVLDRAVQDADGVDEADWIAEARLARAEAHWLDGDDEAARADLRVARRKLTAMEYLQDARVSVWEQRLLRESRPASPAAEPWATWLTGAHRDTAAHWDRLGCPYEAAMALHDSDREEDLREAISRFEALGAEATARRTRQRMKHLGLRAVPTGSRASTREHPLGLTRREDEVLVLLCEGLTNEEVAGRLVLSTRTVDHHVSAILGKLGVGSRGAAVARARELGVVPAGTAGRPTLEPI